MMTAIRRVDDCKLKCRHDAARPWWWAHIDSDHFLFQWTTHGPSSSSDPWRIGSTTTSSPSSPTSSGPASLVSTRRHRSTFKNKAPRFCLQRVRSDLLFRIKAVVLLQTRPGPRETMRWTAETITLWCPESRWRRTSRTTISLRRDSTTTTCTEPASSRSERWLRRYGPADCWRIRSGLGSARCLRGQSAQTGFSLTDRPRSWTSYVLTHVLFVSHHIKTTRKT